MREIRDTWGNPSEVPIHYWTGPFLDVPDDYTSLPRKTKAICRQECLNFDYILKCDTDTYVSTKRLLRSGFEAFDYSGYILDSYEVPYCAGPAYWLSKRAMTILSIEDWSKYPSSHPDCEDVMVGTILAAHGITPHHDERYGHFTPVLPENNQITYHLSCRSPYQPGMMTECHRNANGA